MARTELANAMSGLDFRQALNAMFSEVYAQVFSAATETETALKLVVNSKYPVGDVRRYGADMTGVLDSTDAFHAALNVQLLSPKANGYFLAERGCGVIYIPKGNLRISRTYVAPGARRSVWGLIIVGQGVYTSNINVVGDDVTVLKMGEYSYVSFRDMTLSHINISDDRMSWRTKLIEASGVGGGSEIALVDLQVQNFGVVVDLTGLVNNDTNTFYNVSFGNCVTALRIRSSQAVINSIRDCTFGVRCEKPFDLAGGGYTLFDTVNSVCNGTFLTLTGVLGPGGEGLFGESAVYTFLNCKFEPFNGENENLYSGGSRSAMVGLTGLIGEIDARVNFISTGFSSDVALDPLYPQLQVTPRVQVTWSGGNFMPSGTIQRIAIPWLPRDRKPGVTFRDMRTCPPPSQVRSVDGGANTTHTSLSWRNCTGVTDICVAVTPAPGVTMCNYVHDPLSYNTVENNVTGDAILTYGATADFHSLPFYGFAQNVEAIHVDFIERTAGPMTVSVYSDPARTNLLETINVPDTGAGFNAPRVSATGGAIGRNSTGLYFRITAGGGTNRGTVKVRHSTV